MGCRFLALALALTGIVPVSRAESNLPAPFVFVRSHQLWLLTPGAVAPQQISAPAFGSPSAPVFLDTSGERVMFAAYVADHGGVNIKQADLWTFTAEGLNRYTKTGALTLSPDVTRDGKKITYVSNRYSAFRPGSNSIELYVQRTEWNMGSRTTQDEGSKYSPRWSPEGERIAYQWLKSDQSGIYVLKVRENIRARIAFSGAYPTWRPDGKAVAFVSRGKIWEVDVADTLTASTEMPSPRLLLPDDFKDCASFLRWTDYGLLFQWSRSDSQQGISLLDAKGRIKVLISGAEEFGGSDLAPRN